ncbi:MAG: hypothetical protein WCA46_28120, partial [Actinocatenispora sp.]
AVLATTGLTGVAVAAAGAQPDSPLWPITTVMYPQQAAAREHRDAAVRDLADARRAVALGHKDAALRYLADAERHSREMGPGSDADKLRKDAHRVRASLPAPDKQQQQQSASPLDAGVPTPSAKPPATLPGSESPVPPSTPPTSDLPSPPSGEPSAPAESGTGDPSGPGAHGKDKPKKGKGLVGQFVHQRDGKISIPGPRLSGLC